MKQLVCESHEIWDGQKKTGVAFRQQIQGKLVCCDQQVDLYSAHSRHRTQFEEFEQQEEARAAEKASGQSRGQLAGHSKQVSLEFVVEKQRQFSFDHPKSREIHKLIASTSSTFINFDDY